MRSEQWETCLFVIECRRLPGVHRMARRAVV
jgi:hypothetical protein